MPLCFPPRFGMDSWSLRAGCPGWPRLALLVRGGRSGSRSGGFVLAAGLALLGVDDPERAGLVAWAAGELEGFGGVEDDDAGSAADGLLVAEHVVVVAGDEGVVAGHAVDGEVLDVGDLVAVRASSAGSCSSSRPRWSRSDRMISRRARSAAALVSSVNPSGPRPE
jgi:hypothetical protein